MDAVKTAVMERAPGSSFVGRNQFLIFRLFSLAGVIPMGGYVVVHLLTNASVLGGPATFQAQVDRIHSLGMLLPLVEWTFIFLPILFHALVGVYIISGGLPNTGSYPYSGNIRYTLQRATAGIALLFIATHLWQLHHYGEAIGGGAFKPEHATSSTALALSPIYWKIWYIIGTLCVVYHLSNGIWTFGITWGIWTSDGAQRRAGYVCALFGVLLATAGMGALYGMSTVNVKQAQAIEDRMEETRDVMNGQVPSGASSTQSTPQQSAKNN